MRDKLVNTLLRLLPVLSFIIPFSILYFIDPTFDKSWKGRIFYVFFLWLVSLELILEWEKLRKDGIKLKSARTILLVLALASPTIYTIAANFWGLNNAIVDSATAGGIFWAADMPLSTEYLVFTLLFACIVALEYGIAGLKFHSVSTFFLGIIGIIYTVDNIFPQGRFTPFQIIVPTTANLATNLLNVMGYRTTWHGYSEGMPVISATDSIGRFSGRFAIAWPCSGVESLLIYSVVILLFLRNIAIPQWQKVIYFLYGAVVTYFINILRIVTILIIAINKGDFLAFHDYYGQLYSISWIISYPLLIIATRASWNKIACSLRQKRIEARQH